MVSIVFKLNFNGLRPLRFRCAISGIINTKSRFSTHINLSIFDKKIN
jgi:hypothetical protein